MKINWSFAAKVGYRNYFYRSFIRQFYKRIFRRDFWMTLPSGARYLVPTWDPSGAEVFVTTGMVDDGLEATFYALLPQKSTLIDVGAHTGFYGAYCSPKLAKYIAVEPADRCLPYIAKSVSNQIIERIFHGFAGEFEGARSGRPNDMGYVHIDDEGSLESIPCTTIDVLAKDLKIDGIKIDVDGPDMEVLRGGIATIKRDRPVIIIEHSPDTELLEFMKTLDYGLWGMINHSEKTQGFIAEAQDCYQGKMTLLYPEEIKSRVKAFY